MRVCLCGSNGSFPAAGGDSLGKNVVAKVIAPFPLSEIAHWSILLRGNDIFFGIADPAAELRPHSPHDRPHSLHDRPLAPLIGPIVP